MVSSSLHTVVLVDLMNMPKDMNGCALKEHLVAGKSQETDMRKRLGTFGNEVFDLCNGSVHSSTQSALHVHICQRYES